MARWFARMKGWKNALPLSALALLASGFVHSTSGQIFESHNFTGLNTPIPDNNEFGVSNHQTITSSIDSIGELHVFLDISGDFNGDLYVTLRHNEGFSVLLNRVGRRSNS